MRISTKFLSTALVLLGGILFSASASAEDWMFRRSYFSHAYGPGDANHPTPLSRSAYRPPYASAHPHFAIRGGWRFKNYSLPNGSGGTDTLYYRENFFDMNY